MVFVMTTGQRRRPICVGDCKCLFEDVPNPIKNKRERERETTFPFFPSEILDRTRRTIISSHSCCAHQPGFAVAAYCLKPAGGGPWHPGAAHPAAAPTGLFYGSNTAATCRAAIEMSSRSPCSCFILLLHTEN